MAAKKTAPKVDENATERLVNVTFPRSKNGLNKDHLFKAALEAVRDEIPLRSDLVKELVSNEVISETERKAVVKISWGPHEGEPRESDPEDGDFVGQHLDSLTVPTTLPPGAGGDDDK